MIDKRARRGRHARKVDPSTTLDLVLAVLVPAVLVSGIFLFPFIQKPRTLPFGNDTYAYLWRANLVHEEGIEALTPEGTGLEKSLGERPFHPIMVSLLRSATGRSSLTIMWVLPAVLAACIALAATGLAADAASEHRRTAGLVGIGVGASAYVAWTAVGYSTNLVFDSVALAVVSLAIRSVFGSSRREIVGAGLLLGGGALYHWVLAPLIGALLLAYAAVLGLGRLVLRSAFRPPRGGAVKIAAIIGCALVVAAVGFAFAPELPIREPRGGHAEAFTRVRLPAMALGATLPLAAVGAIAMVLGRDVPVRRRWSAPLLLGWAAFGLVALVGWFWLDRAVLPYRWGGFALGIPILIVLGALSIGDVGKAIVFRVAGIVLASAAVAMLAAAGAGVWTDIKPKVRGTLFGQLSTVTRYAATLPSDTALVFVADPRRLDFLRSGLSPDLFDRIEFTRADVVNSVPDLGRTDPFVILAVEALTKRRIPVDGQVLGPGVELVRGPAASVPAGITARAPPAGTLALLTGACLLVLLLSGLGWALALTDLPILGAIGLAPAFGLAIVGLCGLIADRAGVPLRGPGAWGVLAAAAGLGGALAAWMRRAGTSTGETAASTS